MRKTHEEYEGEDWCMLHDDTPPEGGEFIYTAEDLEENERIKKALKEKFKHHFE